MLKVFDLFPGLSTRDWRTELLTMYRADEAHGMTRGAAWEPWFIVGAEPECQSVAVRRTVCCGDWGTEQAAVGGDFSGGTARDRR